MARSSMPGAAALLFAVAFAWPALACEGTDVVFEDKFADDGGGWAINKDVQVKDGGFTFKLPPDAMQSDLNVTYSVNDADICAEGPSRFEAGLLSKVGLQDFRNKYPTQLSGGMQRRAELARAMINNPQIMILDEPFRGLDAMTKELMWEYYAALYEENRRTNFFVTTDIDEAIFLADRLLIMSNIPTQVRAVIEVDVPRPRRLSDLVENDRSNEIKMEALSILHEEAMKSFSRGSKAAADFVDAYSKRMAKT